MKTTLEIPDPIYRRAKFKAAQQGISLRQFVTEAIREKLKLAPVNTGKPWMKHVGKLKHLRNETAWINKILEEEFERTDP